VLSALEMQPDAVKSEVDDQCGIESQRLVRLLALDYVAAGGFAPCQPLLH
jgi:hypothetical protein